MREKPNNGAGFNPSSARARRKTKGAVQEREKEKSYPVFIRNLIK
jgi:hypothetical protein